MRIFKCNHRLLVFLFNLTNFILRFWLTFASNISSYQWFAHTQSVIRQMQISRIVPIFKEFGRRKKIYIWRSSSSKNLTGSGRMKYSNCVKNGETLWNERIPIYIDKCISSGNINRNELPVRPDAEQICEFEFLGK